MSSENFGKVPGEDKDVIKGDAPMTEAELKEAEEMYKVASNSNTSKAAFGAMVLGAAMAAAPGEAEAQVRERMTDSTKISVESEKSPVKEGVVIHPELGKLNIQIFRKEIDLKNPVYGANHEVVINGEQQKVESARFLRNGSGGVTISLTDGSRATIRFDFPARPTFTKEGGEPVSFE